MKTCILLPAKKKEVDNYRERQMRHPICRNLSPLMMLLATQAGAQDRSQDYWHYVAGNRMLYSCDNLDWERRPEVNRFSKSCLAFSCDYKSPSMMILIRDYLKPVIIEAGGNQKRINAMETAEEKDFADFFDMDARTIVLAGTNALADEVAKDWRITTAEKSYLFLSPNAGEGAEAAFAKFSENCL